MPGSPRVYRAARLVGGVIAAVGVLSVILAPMLGSGLSTRLWGVEPLAYVGALLLIAGLGAVALSYTAPAYLNRSAALDMQTSGADQEWSRITQQYFELFEHDLGRPLRRILGLERELRAQSSGDASELAAKGLFDEIEQQTANFRLMMSNIQVLIQMEGPQGNAPLDPVEPSQIVRRIADRYAFSAQESGKEITWWAEPDEFGIVHANSSALEHIVANLVDNAARYAESHIEIKLTKNPTHIFVRVWDDGPGILSQYLPHLFDRGWTPEVARREEKTSSGLGLFIARTLAQRFGGNLTVTSETEGSEHHTAFLLGLPI